MGNFEKLSVLVIVVIIVMILVVALYTWQDNGDTTANLDSQASGEQASAVGDEPVFPGPARDDPWPEPPLVNPDPSPDPSPGPLEVPGPEPLPESILVPLPDPVPGPVNPPSEPSSGGDPSATENWVYVIQDRDTLSEVCQNHLGTIRRQKEVKALNPEVDWLKIRAGDQIKMPPKGAHVSPDSADGSGPGETDPRGVVSSARAGKITKGDYYVSTAGDTVQSIAKRAYGNMDRWPEIWSRNLKAIPNIDVSITTGTRIFIPN